MTSRPLPRRLGVAALATSFVALLAGCFAAEMKLTINDDDVDIAYTLLVDVDQLGELAGMLGSELPDLSALSGEALIDEILEGDDPCADIRTAFADREVASTEVDEGGRRGVRCSVAAVPFAELSRLNDDTVIAITRDGGTTSVTIDLDGVDDLTAEGDQLGAEIGMAFQDIYEIRFVVSGQGTLTDHNASSIEGTTATWLITPTADFIDNGTARLRATWTGNSSGGDAGMGVGLVVAVVVGVLVVAAVVVVLVRRRSSPRTGTPLPPPPPPPPYAGGGA